MNSRAMLYFALGVLGVVVASRQPTDIWGWVILISSALYQGLLALKAWQSPGGKEDKPAPVVVTNPPSNPVITENV